MVGIFSYYQTNGSCWVGIDGVIFAFLMSVTFMIGTFCLLLACLTSLSTGGIISKTIYVGVSFFDLCAYYLYINYKNTKIVSNLFSFLQELIYHSVAAILLLACSINLLISVTDRYRKHDAYMAAAIMGLINTVLYFISAFLAHRSYRGI